MSLTSYLLSHLPPSVSRLEIVRRFFACPKLEEELNSTCQRLDKIRIERTQWRLKAEDAAGELACKNRLIESLARDLTTARSLVQFTEKTITNWQERAFESGAKLIDAIEEICQLKEAADRAALHIEELEDSDAGKLRIQLLASQQSMGAEIKRLTDENRTLRRDNEDLRSRVVLRADEVGAVEEP